MNATSKDGTVIAYEKSGQGPALKIPTLAMSGSKTTDRLKKAARGVADAVPGARHQELAGQTHMVNPAVLEPVVSEFFNS